MAARQGHAEVCKMLIGAGADPFQVDKYVINLNLTLATAVPWPCSPMVSCVCWLVFLINHCGCHSVCVPLETWLLVHVPLYPRFPRSDDITPYDEAVKLRDDPRTRRVFLSLAWP
jgi:hypothetical protein